MKNIIIVIALIIVSAGLYAGWGNIKEKEINSQDIIKKETKETMTNPRILLKTNKGEIELELLADKTPNTAANFTKLASEGFYNGTKFHRVIKGFMIQGGDPLSKDDSKRQLWGTGGPGYKFNDELTGQEKYPEGTLAMANSGPNTNGSQFFIVTASPEAPLPPSYTVFGKVVRGMDVALQIENVKTGPTDQPLDDVVIQSATVK
ncbi:MAG: hypothetical protein A2648_02135 [Candidatus Lloydbacteria bacterium RIFCSPHIGHO2_01_FULL_41_20]|uniref:Peptidyl-prolyl cis-trans isomerase n=1 Tax=Candidatus Lloydbacteria bacterium RIFCSPHIGHO2_01_FULL_41_20 TaxID=1798657 RepID=A0A1G2CST7_9BACT|nr:MAG: hypothetical protein A2648_02135 [Candidatus Lloydbacteria bacterium RIFCSPHIGHO2_01_FULL_41_20]